MTNRKYPTMDRDEFDKTVVAPFRDGLQIDRHSLDDAVEEHSGNYLKVQESYILAKSLADEAETDTKHEAAEAAFRARKAMEKAKEKWTETQIKEHIAVDDEHLAAIAREHECSYRADILSALVKAYEQRGKMLHELSALYQSGYYSLQSTRATENNVKEETAERNRTVLASLRSDLRKRPSLGRGRS
jgi:hypothetical protein